MSLIVIDLHSRDLLFSSEQQRTCQLQQQMRIHGTFNFNLVNSQNNLAHIFWVSVQILSTIIRGHGFLLHFDVSTILLGRRLIYVSPRGVVNFLTRLPFKNSIGPIRSHNSFAVQRSLIEKMQSSNMTFIARRSSRLTIASGVRNTDQSSFKSAPRFKCYTRISSRSILISQFYSTLNLNYLDLTSNYNTSKQRRNFRLEN